MPTLPPKSTSETSTSLLGMDLPAIQALLSDMGEPAFRARQVYDWLYAKAVDNYDAMANLPASLRTRLTEHLNLGRTAVSEVAISSDGTRKYLFPTGSGTFIESAWIPEPERSTLCISTQVGCKMGCLFCATARMGFRGHLSAGQIVNQYLSLPERPLITNIVYMGMGEPLDNPRGTFGSLSLLTDPAGIKLSAKRITLSTIGLPEPLQEFLERFDSHLAISIHSPFNDERKSLMPIQHVHPIAEIIGLLKAYRFDDHRRLSFEYIMFDGINDSLSHARELVRLVNGLHCRINLIHYHSVPGNDLQGSPRPVMEAFQNLLKEKGLIATIRKSRGEDIQAACGLLSTKARLARPTDTDF